MPNPLKPKKAVQALETTPRPPITLARVKSQQIAAAGYSPELQIIAVQFHPRRGETTAVVYHYAERTPEHHAAFIGAESLGTHHGIHLKPLPFKSYPAEVLPPIPEE